MRTLLTIRFVCVGLAACALAAAGTALFWPRLPESADTPGRKSVDSDLSLPEAEREYLWEVEHHASVDFRQSGDRIQGLVKLVAPGQPVVLLFAELLDQRFRAFGAGPISCHGRRPPAALAGRALQYGRAHRQRWRLAGARRT